MPHATHDARLPLAINAINAVGKLLGVFGIHPFSLKPATLMRKARRATGLRDFGPDSFHIGLEKLSQSLNDEGQLTLFGRMLAQRDLQGQLENRLQLVDAFHQHPEISGRPIKRPIFILGLPRTGTSILHELLTQDPDNRVPLSWEAKYPFPAPRTQTYRSDPRIAKVAKELRQVDRLLPEFKKMHPMGAEFPQECIAFTAMHFMSIIFDTAYRAPGYQEWFDNEADVASAYDLHYQFLQFLQWQHPAKRWVLKSPGHLWSLDALLKRYPDAQIIQTHRDPVKVLASVSSLVTMLRSLASDKVELKEIALHQAELLSEGLNRCMQVRKTGILDDSQVYDLQFHEFMQDPIASVEQIYQHFGYELSDKAAANMRRFLMENPADKHGKHHYRFIDTGLSLESERKRFKEYQDYFSVPSEKL